MQLIPKLSKIAAKGSGNGPKFCWHNGVSPFSEGRCALKLVYHSNLIILAKRSYPPMHLLLMFLLSHHIYKIRMMRIFIQTFDLQTYQVLEFQGPTGP